MSAHMLSSRRRLWGRFWRKKTRYLRLLMQLIRWQWRAWLLPAWPIKFLTFTEYPSDPWPSNVANGRAIMNGEFCPDMGGDPYEDFWDCLLDLPNDVQRRMHEFKWLRDVAATESELRAAEFARELIDEWWDKQERHHEAAMDISTRAERLSMCLRYQGFLAKGAPLSWLQNQHRYYLKEMLLLADFMRRRGEQCGLSTLKALLFSTLLFPAMGFLSAPVNRFLKQAIEERFYEDGGHVTRSPEFLHRDVTNLMDIRAAMKKRQIPIPPDCDEALQKSLDALASLTHGDHKTACFHTAIERQVDALNQLWVSWRKSRPLAQKTLPNSGYVHLASGDSRVIMDVGYTPSLGKYHHAAPLAFEFSREGARFIANCGSYRGDSEAWQEASYHTAAHSTLCLDYADAWELTDPECTPKRGHCVVEETEDGICVKADHYGYAEAFNLLHERTLTVSNAGEEITGKDMVQPIVSPSPSLLQRHQIKPKDVFLRFHLHPSVSVAKVTPQFLMLKLRNDEFWEFSVLDREEVVPHVEESVYLGQTGLPEKTVQLLIKAPYEETAESPLTIRWQLKLNKTVKS